MVRKVPRQQPQQAEIQAFQNEIHTVQRLSEELVKRKSNARFNRLLGSATVTNPGLFMAYRHRVSYWEFLDGGTLKHVMDAARSREIRIPQWFMMRYVIHILETLDLMHTMPEDPDNKIPDFVLIDFGSAGKFLPKTDTGIPFADIISVGTTLEAMAHPHYGDLEDPKNSCFVAVIYRELQKLNLACVNSGGITLPSVRPLIGRAKGYAQTLALAPADTNFDAVELSTRPSAYGKMSREPFLRSSLEGAVGSRGVPGPWYPARVLTATGEVVGIDRRKSYHTP
ncbi:hypothetical protein GQ53DRAFT_768792 [Thozetella sp. PMI_491]|nr:hypothetical protein GQ53DRAFT_768792 [Thozetella sp. PMI_491]